MKLTPSGAVKAQCRDCLSLDRYSRNEIEGCKGDTCHSGPCPLFPYRLGKRPPVKVFRAFCFQCMGGSAPLVRECETVRCPIHLYRLGRNPARAGMGNPKSLVKRGVETAFSKREGAIWPTFEERHEGGGHAH